MDNQHKKIKGYRDLSQEEIDLMNEIKGAGVELEKLVEKLTNSNSIATENTPDQKWVYVGETHLQQGIMALVRSVAKPESF